MQTGPPLGIQLKKAHLVLSWDLNLKNFSGENLEYKKGDYKKLSKFLDEQDWTSKFESKNVQDCYKEFLTI